MKKEKDTLQITISKAKVPRSKFGNWFYWQIYWQIWCIYRPKFLAWFFKLFISKKRLEELYKEEFNVIIKKEE